MKNLWTRTLMLAILTTMLMAMMGQALAASFEAVVTSDTMKVYRKAEPHDQIGEVPKGTVVTVKDWSGKAALISYRGFEGIARVSDMKAASAKAEKSDEKAEESVKAEKASSSELKNAVAVVTTKKAKVYKRASKSSDYVKVKSGVKLNLLAVKNGVAKVERDGVVGYMYADCLTEVKTADVKTAEVKVEKSESSKKSSSGGDIFSGSNRDIIYKFLTKEMGYNTAAACGILANIKYESDYKPTTGGDGGSSYGIVQWHADRKTKMINWCNSNGYDSSSLKGQLYYFKHEMKSDYPAIHSKLKSVSNTAQGAYDAGYEFCYNYEAPSNKASRSANRGKYARDTLFDIYKA